MSNNFLGHGNGTIIKKNSKKFSVSSNSVNKFFSFYYWLVRIGGVNDKFCIFFKLR